MDSRPPPAPKSLRDRAEVRLGEAPAAPVASEVPADSLKLLHELQVHQIELQMQNEQLLATQEALTAALQHQRSLYDDAPVGYCTVDVEGRILEANVLAGSLLDCPLGALPGRRLGAMLSAEGARALAALLRDTAARPTLQRCEAVAAGPPELVAGAAPAPRTLQIDAHREPGGQATRLALVDISERKRAEDLSLRVRTAEQANEAKSLFFAQMNHELRTPLNAILGFAHLLRRQREVALGDTLTGWAEHIERAGMHMLALVTDGLDLARIEAGRVDAALEPVALDAALAQALEMVETLARAQRVRIGLAPGSSPGLQAWAAPRLLQQILLNLLGNAVKYNRPGGTVHLSLSSAAGHVVLEVGDNGPGLGAEQMARLFQPFDRLGAEHGPIEGTGLGLLISRRLAEAMKGTLTLRSEAGVGTTVTLVLTACS